MEKKVSRILAIASREIVAAKACYHRTCYKGYTRTEASHNWGFRCEWCGSLEYEYAYLESEANIHMLFDYIRSNVLANKEIIRLHEMTELLVSDLMFVRWRRLVFTKKHIRRNLQAEFGDVLVFKNFDTNHQCLHSSCQFDATSGSQIYDDSSSGKTGQC